MSDDKFCTLHILSNPFNELEKKTIRSKTGKLCDILDEYVHPLVNEKEDISDIVIFVNGYEVEDRNKLIVADDIVVVSLKVGFTAAAIFGKLAWMGWFAYIATAVVYLAQTMAVGYVVGLVMKAITNPEEFFGFADTIDSSPTYGWAGIRNTREEGAPISILFGKHKIGGTVISEYIRIENGKSVLYTLLGLCGGPIDAITEIELNDQPYVSYKGVTVYNDRLGSLNDTAIPGFDEIYNTSRFREKLSNGTPNIKQTSGNIVEKIVVEVLFPQGLGYFNHVGGIDIRAVSISVAHRKIGDTEWIADGTLDVSKATVDPVREEFVIDNLAPAQYEVKLERLTNEETDIRYKDDVYYSAITEVIKQSLQYPGLAKLGVTAIATDQLNENRPKITCVAEKRTVQVYNPYTDMWESKLATNPSWITYCLLNQYGKINHTRIDYDAFLDWATYCDELVNGKPRFSLNIVFDIRSSLWDCCQRVGKMTRSVVVRRGNVYSVVVDKPMNVTYDHIFTDSNIIKDSFAIQYASKKDRSNAVEVSFLDETKDYERQTITIYGPDYKSSGNLENTTSVQLFGVTDREQAIREGAFLLNNNIYLNRLISFDAHVDSFACTIGDVVKVQHGVMNYEKGKTGRVVDARNDDVNGYAELDIETKMSLKQGEAYRVAVRLNDDTIVEKTHIPVNEDQDVMTLKFTDIWSTVPESGDLFAFGETLIMDKLYRIVNITRGDSDDVLTRKIECVEYSSEIYNDQDFVYADPYWENNVQSAVNVELFENLIYATDGSYTSDIRVSWDPVYSPEGYSWAVWLEDQTAGTEPILVSTPNALHTIIDPSYLVLGHTYKVYVGPIGSGAVDNNGENVANITLQGKLAPPSDVTNFNGLFNSTYRYVRFTWSAIADIDADHYEIRQGNTWDLGTVVNDNVVGVLYNYYITDSMSGTYRFWIKAVDSSGVYSENAVFKDVLINTSNCVLQVPTNPSLYTYSALGQDGSDHAYLRLTWDSNAEISDDFLKYEVMLIRDFNSHKFPGETRENQYSWEVIPNQSYTAKVRAIDKGGNFTNWSVSVTKTSAKDSTPPSAPIWDTLISGIRTMGLKWTHVTDTDLSHYEIERSSNGNFSGEEEFVANVKTTTFVDSDLISGATYYWRIRAVDTSGNNSDWSSAASGQPGKATGNDIAYNSIVANHVDTSEVFTMNIRSQNYVADTSGFSINAVTGVTEFNNMLLRMSGGNGKIIVGQNNIIIDSATNDIIVAPDGGIAGQDYARFYNGDVEFFYWDGTQHVPYKSISRIEAGVAQNGVAKKLPGIFKRKPEVIVSPNIITTYDPAHNTQVLDIVNNTNDPVENPVGSGIYWITPIIELRVHENNYIQYPWTGENIYFDNPGWSSVSWRYDYSTIKNSNIVDTLRFTFKVYITSQVPYSSYDGAAWRVGIEIDGVEEYSFTDTYTVGDSSWTITGFFGYYKVEKLVTIDVEIPNLNVAVHTMRLSLGSRPVYILGEYKYLRPYIYHPNLTQLTNPQVTSTLSGGSSLAEGQVNYLVVGQ